MFKGCVGGFELVSGMFGRHDWVGVAFMILGIGNANDFSFLGRVGRIFGALGCGDYCDRPRVRDLI